MCIIQLCTLEEHAHDKFKSCKLIEHVNRKCCKEKRHRDYSSHGQPRWVLHRCLFCVYFLMDNFKGLFVCDK